MLEKFQNRQPSVGTFTHLKSTVAVECMAYTGLDYVILDTEHCPADMDFISSAVTAAENAGVTPLVRINEIARAAVLRPLDIGAKGLIVPAVETPEQVRQLIQFAKFQPLGNRGFCPTRDGGWGFAENALHGAGAYMEDCNRQALLIPQCETAGCLEHIEEIVAMEGVDGIFVGPLDLSIALGCPMELDAPQMVSALRRIQAACRNAGKLSMIFCGDAAAAKANLAAGFDSVTTGLDAMLYISAYRSLVNSILE